jgi:peptidoglycan L-alanyl-D-glutamate endopeptidase CwlK
MSGFFYVWNKIIMPRYGNTSTKRLFTCHVDLQLIFNTVIAKYDNSILCGFRPKKEQNQAFDDGLSQVKYPNSKHNSFPSMAVDAGPYFIDLKNTDWEDHKAFCIFAGYVKRVADELLEQNKIIHKLRWGGDWDGDGRTVDEGFVDLPHFELMKI